MTNQISSPSPDTARRNGINTSIFVGLLQAVFTFALYSVGSIRDVSVLIQASIITAVIMGASIISIIFCLYRRIKIGIWLIIITILIGIPIISLLIAEYGWIIFVSVPIVVFTAAQLNLPSNQLSRAVIFGFISGLTGLLLDIFGSPNRLAMPNYEIILPIVAGILLVIGFAILARQFQHLTLRSKLLVLFLVVALIPTSILIFWNNYATRSALTESANQSLSAVAAQTGEQIDRFIQDSLDVVEEEANIDIFRIMLELDLDNPTLMEGGVIDTFHLLISKNPEYIKSYSLLNREGEYILSSPFISGDVPLFLGFSRSVTTNIQNVVLTNIPYSSPVIIDPVTGETSIFFAARTSSLEGDPLGLLIVEYDAKILQTLITEKNNAAGESSFGILLDENHIYLANGMSNHQIFKSVTTLEDNIITILQESNRIPSLLSEQLSINAEDFDVLLQGSKTQPTFLLEDSTAVEGKNQVAVYSLDTKPWKVVFFQPQDIFLAPAQQQSQTNIILGLVVVAFVTIFAIYVARFFGAPISNLTELVERISTGQLDLEVPIITNDEIGRLGSAFNSMTAQLRNLLGGLELQVTERTQELERRAVQLQTAAEIARDASTAQDVDTLLNNAVRLISDRFDFYHAGIFLLDEAGEFAVLRSANSKGGRLMVTNGHKLRVGQVGIVGNTTQTGKPHIALDVGEDAVHFANPYLPETRSEMAIPLIVGNQIIGALDVQSKQQNAFDEEDITIIQVMADQLAVAIRNNQLFEETQQTVLELQSAYGEYTQRSWKEWQDRSQFSGGYRFRGSNIEYISTPTSGENGNEKLISNESETKKLIVPIKLRDVTIGMLNLQLEDGEATPDTVELISEIASRLALTIDNARLLETTQRKAAQEQYITEISSRMRETLDIDTILQTTVREIGQRLGLHDVSIQFNSETSDSFEKDA